MINLAIYTSFLVLILLPQAFGFWGTKSECHNKNIDTSLKRTCASLKREAVMFGNFKLQKDTSTAIQIQNYCLKKKQKSVCHNFIKYELENFSAPKVKAHRSSSASYTGIFNGPIKAGLTAAMEKCTKWHDKNAKGKQILFSACDIPKCYGLIKDCLQCENNNKDWQRLCTMAHDNYRKVSKAEVTRSTIRTPDVNLGTSNGKNKTGQ